MYALNDLYKSKEYEKCNGCGFYAEIGPDGTMYHCCERLLLDEYVIGNVFKESIYDIYRSDRRKTVVQKINDNIKLCPPVCKPHEINKQLAILGDTIEEKDIQRYKIWYNGIVEQGKNVTKYVLSQYNPFER